MITIDADDGQENTEWLMDLNKAAAAGQIQPTETQDDTE